MCAGSNRPPTIAQNPVPPSPVVGAPGTTTLPLFGGITVPAQKPGQPSVTQGPVIPPAPSLTAMLLGERMTPKVGVESLKLPLISTLQGTK